MNSRERIVAALQHKEADRIPFDLGGTESSGITGIAYNNLRRHLGLGPGQTQIFDVYQQIAKIEEDVRAVLPSDTIPLLIEPKRWKPFVLPDGSACQIPEKWNPVKDARGDWVVKNSQGMVTARLPQQGFYFESVYAPLSRVEKPGELAAYADDIESFDWPFYADETWADLAGRAQHLFEHTDRAVVANLQLHLLAAGQILRGYENFMIDLAADQKLAHALLARLTEAYLARCERYFEQVGAYVQVVLVNDDLGTQQGPMMSPDCYRRMIRPYQKRLFGSRRASMP